MPSSSTWERLVAPVAVASVVLIAIGGWLPWLSLYAGLHPMRGVIGPYGRVIVGGGAACVLAGVRYWRGPTTGLRWALACLGWALVGITTWLTAQLLITYRELQANPMLVPRLGPGLFLALGSSVLVGVTVSFRLWRSGRSSER